MAPLSSHAAPIRIAALALAAAALAAAAGPARAQSCCVSTGASDFAVVGRRESAAVAAMLVYEPTIASYDERGRYEPIEGRAIHDLTIKLGVGLRPLAAARGWQLNLAVPLRYQYRDFEGLPPAHAFGLGDVSFGTRYTLLEDRLTGFERGEPASFLPYVDLVFGAKTRTGRPEWESDEVTQVDAMGDGSWGLTFGVALDKFVTRTHSVLLGFEYELRLPREEAAGAEEFDPGDVTTYRLAWQYAPRKEWSGSLFSTVRISYPARLGGAAVEDSQTLRWRFGLSVTWVFVVPTWEVTASLTADPWWDGVGYSLEQVGPSASLQLRRNFL